MFCNVPKIYRLKNFDDLKKYENKKNYIYFKYVCHFLYITKEYERLSSYLSKFERLNISAKHNELLTYYRCLVALEKKENYTFEKLYVRLLDKYKDKMQMARCNTNEELIKLFDNKIANNFFSRSNRKIFGKNVFVLYLLNLVRRQNYTYDKIINILFCYFLKLILKKKDIGINNLLWLISILNVTNLYYSYNFDYDREYPIPLDLLNNIVYKVKDFVLLYKGLFLEKLIDYNEAICLSFRMLLSLDTNVDNQKKYHTELCNFILNNDVSEYTKFIYKIVEERNSIEKVSMDTYLDTIKKILTGEMEGESLHVIYMCCAFLKNESELNVFKKKFFDIENVVKVNEFLVGKIILSFWCGEKVSLEGLSKNIYINDFMSALIKYSNKEISYDSFLKEIDSVIRIDSFTIFNWNVFNKIFCENDLRWLIAIINKVSPIDYDIKLDNYLLKIYTSILNNNKHIFLEHFMMLDAILCEKCISQTVHAYSVMCFINVYNLYNDYVNSKIVSILSDSRVFVNSESIFISFIANITLFYLKFGNANVELIKTYIDNSNLNEQKKIFSYISLLCFDKSFLNEELYCKLISILIILHNDKIRKDYEFALISYVANHIIKNKHFNIPLECDLIYYSDNQFYVLDSNYNMELDGIYNSLKIVKIEKVDDKFEKESLMGLLISRIYFGNIENFGAGRMISVSGNLKGKEFIDAFLKELGYDDSQEIISLIESGQIINGLWLNQYNIHQFMKKMKTNVSKIFSNSFNNLNIGNKKIIHITAFALIAKLGLVDRLHKCGKYYGTGYSVKIISSMYHDGTIDMIDGIVEDAVCYDDLLKDILDCLEQMKKDNHIEYVSSANTLGNRGLKNFNDFDEEFFKILISYKKSNIFSIVTEDPFYFKTSPINTVSHGVYTLLVDMYVNGVISDEELYKATTELELLNYNLRVNYELYSFLVSKSDNLYISKIIDILNNYI